LVPRRYAAHGTAEDALRFERVPRLADFGTGAEVRAIGSAGERLVHTEEVTGSIPVSPTQVSGRFRIAEPAFLIFRQQQARQL
jgi:hypothetical protein